MSQLNVAAVQMCSGPDWQVNLEFALDKIAAVAQQGAQMVILPENALLFDGKSMRKLAESKAQNSIMTALSDAARRHAIWLIVDSHPMMVHADGKPVADSRVRQSLLVFDPNGQLAARYDKMHLFDVAVADAVGVYKESAYIEPGEAHPTVIEIEGMRIGLSICYDVRFPELFRALKADVIIVPAAFTYRTGDAHWHTLLRARAIENQAYVVGVNQGGVHSDTRRTYGHTLAYSPWGDCLAELQETPDTIQFVVESELLTQIRTDMPALQHRRLV